MKQKDIEKILYYSVIEICDKLNVYKTLFMEENSLKILESCDYGTISIFKDSLGHDIARLIYRLLDPRATRIRKNLERENCTFIYYKESFKVSKEIKEKINELIELRKKIALYRNRVLSHSDLNTELKLEKKPFLQWKEVNYIINVMKEILIEVFKKHDEELYFISTNVNPDLFLNALTRKK